MSKAPSEKTQLSMLSRLFRREEMDGDGRCATYLVRWTLLKLWGGIGLYLHHFVGDDWSLDLHDHPKRFISVGLWGGYIEQCIVQMRVYDTYHGGLIHQPREIEVAYRAPWVRTFAAEHTHRIRLIDKEPCWTLVLVLRTSRRWGFWHQQQWIPWRQYVGSETATKMKSCP